MLGLIGRAFALAAAVCLAACGGGGGGGDAVPAPAGPNAPAPGAIVLTTAFGEPDATATIPLTIDQAGGGTYFSVTSDNTSIVTAQLDVLTATTGRILLKTVWSSSAGTYNTNVRARSCTDSRCTNVVRSEVYPVAVVFLQPLKASPSFVQLTAMEGAANQQVDLSMATPGGGALSVKVDAGNSGSWLEAQVTTDNTVRLTASTGSRGPAQLSAKVAISYTRTGGQMSSVQVPVSFTIGKGLAVPAAREFTLDAVATQAGVSGAVPVQRTDNAAIAWTATSSADWLVLSPGSGTSPSTLGYSVDLAKTADLKNFASHTATVTISAAPLSPASFVVTLKKRVPFVAAVMPYGIPAGTVSRVVVGGGGFMQYPNLLASLKTGGLAVSNLQILSDTQVAFTVNPPAAGDYPVTLANASSAPAPGATLKAAAPNPYAPAVVASTRNAEAIVHDPVRQAVYAISWWKNALYKFQHAGGGWSVSTMALERPGGLAIAPDGRLLVMTGAGLVQVDPNLMRVTANFGNPWPNSSTNQWGQAITADNRLWRPESRLGFMDLSTNEFSYVPINPAILDYGTYSAPADGSTLLVSPSLLYSPRGPAQVYNPATAGITSVPANSELGDGQFSADGSMFLLRWWLYNRSFQLVGQLGPLPQAVVLPGEYQKSYEGVDRTAISPDGRFIYGVVTKRSTNGAPLGQRVIIYSTETFEAGTTNFAQVGSLPISLPAAACPATTSDCDYSGKVQVSLDGKTLFYLGNQSFQVFRLQ